MFPDSPGPVWPQSHPHCAGLWDLFLLHYFHFGDFVSISIDISHNQSAEIFLLFHTVLFKSKVGSYLLDIILMWINIGEWGLVSYMGNKVTNDILGKRHKVCKNEEMWDTGSSVWGTQWDAAEGSVPATSPWLPVVSSSSSWVASQALVSLPALKSLCHPLALFGYLAPVKSCGQSTMHSGLT